MGLLRREEARQYFGNYRLGEQHAWVTNILKRALGDVAHEHFIGWDNDWQAARTVVMESIPYGSNW